MEKRQWMECPQCGQRILETDSRPECDECEVPWVATGEFREGPDREHRPDSPPFPPEE